jgi:hypothetical protein
MPSVSGSVWMVKRSLFINMDLNVSNCVKKYIPLVEKRASWRLFPFIFVATVRIREKFCIAFATFVVYVRESRKKRG